MTEPTLKELDTRLQKQADNAQKAIDRGNPNYSIDICMTILKREPGCVDVRRILRKAQLKAFASKSKGLTKFLSGVTNAPFMIKANSQAKKDPAQAIETAEKMLSSNPTNASAHKLLGQSAMALEMPETAVFAFESLRDHDPDNVEGLNLLGEAYIAAGRPSEAVRVGDLILKRDPANADAQTLIKKASVAHTMDRGKWEEEGDFRDKLKDTEEAVALEKASRVVNDEETLNNMIEKAKARVEEDPENVNLYRDISKHYRALHDYENAIEWIKKARELPKGAADTTLEQTEIDLITTKLKQDVESAKEAADASPEDAAAKSALETAEKELNDYRMEQTALLVEKYPNNYEYRYEYGDMLFNVGRHDEAAQQFQLAQRSPKVRNKALLHLGMAFMAGKKFDLAADQLRTARDEMPIMDNQKKQVIYELAVCLEMMGNKEEAFNEFKSLYSADIGYRDVSDRVNKYYEEKSKG